MGGESLDLVKAQCPSLGECQHREAGMGGLVSISKRNEMGGCSKRKCGKGIKFEI